MMMMMMMMIITSAGGNFLLLRWYLNPNYNRNPKPDPNPSPNLDVITVSNRLHRCHSLTHGCRLIVCMSVAANDSGRSATTVDIVARNNQLVAVAAGRAWTFRPAVCAVHCRYADAGKKQFLLHFCPTGCKKVKKVKCVILRRKLKTHLFGNLVRTLYCSLCGLFCAQWSLKLLLRPP